MTHTHTHANVPILVYIQVLKQISDLRGATTAADKPAQYSGHGRADRKDARKTLRRLAAAESEKDHAEEWELRAQEQAEMLDLMSRQYSETATPSVSVCLCVCVFNTVLVCVCVCVCA